MKLPDLLAGKKFVAHYVMYTHDFFLEESIESVVPFVDLILIAQTTKPWFGKEVDLSQTNEILNKIKKKYAGKIEIYKDEFVDEQTQRNFLISKSQSLGYDGAFIVDCDEIFIEGSFNKIYGFIAQNSPKALRIPYLTFIKDASFVVTPPYEDGIFYIDLKSYVEFSWARNVNVEVTLMPYRKPEILHFSYVRENDEAILNKVKSFMHIHDTDWDYWYNNIYLNVNPNIQNFHPIWPERWNALELFDSDKFPRTLYQKLLINKKLFFNQKIKNNPSIKLHLGCGPVVKEEYINIDLFDEHADVKMNITILPYFETNSVDEIYMNAVFEHLYSFEQDKALCEWFRILKKGGKLIINATPDFDEVVKAYINKAKGNWGEVFNLYEVFRYTHGDYKEENKIGQMHKDIFTKEKMRKLIEKAGFEIENIESICWGNEPNPVSINIRAIKNIAVVETEKVENELVEAEKFIDSQEYQNAKEILQNILAKDRQNVDALNDLVIVAILENDIASAIGFINKVLSIDEKNEIAFENINYLSEKFPDQIQIEDGNFSEPQSETNKNNGEKKNAIHEIKNYNDIVKNYDEYIYFQTQKYISHELDNELWSEGQSRYIKSEFENVNRNSIILDIACGDGVGLKVFKNMFFNNVIGVEIAEEKLKRAKAFGYNIVSADMHDLSIFENHKFDLIYSSHTLEHAYHPSIVVKEFYRILKPGGKLKIVLPYPDLTHINDEAHGGKYELNTNKDDNGISVINFFIEHSFKLLDKKFDDFREPEIWLTFSKDDCDINSMDEIESGNQESSKSKFEYNIPNKELLQENYPPLTFKRINSFSDFKEYNNQMQREYLKRNAFEKALLSAEEHFQVQGICISCSKKVGFIVDYWNAHDTNEGKVPNWRERLVCPECNLNNRMRLSLHLIKELISDPLKQRVYISEQTTVTYLKLRSIFGDVTGSEFLGPEVPPGFINNNGIRNEDFTNLSFEKEEFDLVLSFDVFEHIYDYKKAFAEAFRVLKNGGSLLFTVPFAPNSEQNITRAKLKNDGSIEHLLAPEYHGDPMNTSEDFLCYFHFGWEMLNDLKEVGFDEAYSLFCYSKEYAYLGDDQVLFVAKKSKTDVKEETDSFQEKLNTQIKKAEELIGADHLDDAKEILETILLAEPNNIDSLIDLAVIEIIKNNFEDAKKKLNIVLNLDPGNPIATENLIYLNEQIIENHKFKRNSKSSYDLKGFNSHNNKKTISVNLIILNEIDFIQKWLENTVPFVDEIVIIDGGSTDGTIEKIVEFDSKKIKLYNWKQESSWYSEGWNESARRNLAIIQSTSDYILKKDVDEFFLEQDYMKMRELIEQDDDCVFCFPRLNFWGNMEHIRKNTESDPHWYPDYQGNLWNARIGLKYSNQPLHCVLELDEEKYTKTKLVNNIHIFHYHWSLGKKIKINDLRRGDLVASEDINKLPKESANKLVDENIINWRKEGIIVVKYEGSHPKIIHKYLGNHL